MSRASRFDAFAGRAHEALCPFPPAFPANDAEKEG